MKLTEAQAGYLATAASKQGVGAGGVLNRTATALEGRGLLRRYHDARGLGHWLITPAGRSLLAPTEDDNGQ